MSSPLQKGPLRAIRRSSPSTFRWTFELICPECAHSLPPSTRQFSTTRRRSKAMPMQQHATNVDAKLPRSPSMKGQMKQMNRSQIGSDIGKLPGTLVMPPWSELPSLLTWKRWKIHWLQLKTNATQIGSYVPDLIPPFLFVFQPTLTIVQIIPRPPLGSSQRSQNPPQTETPHAPQ
jgi:hypothetical protein